MRAGALILRHLGFSWVWFRLRYALQKRLGGIERRTPAIATWAELPARPLQWHRGVQKTWRPASPATLAQAEGILRGRFQLFGHREIIAGIPPRWSQNPLTGESAPSGVHWSRLNAFSFGDIKLIWELSRFPWAFPLARAFAATGDSRYSEAFWTLLTDWLEHNPPNQGPNWMCGQEATFRLIAVTFAAETMGETVTQEREAVVARLVAATGRRIEGNLEYALSQKNNHGISECVGLITCALLLEKSSETARWLQLGLSRLSRQLAELVYADGSFSQHSLIYHRVLLHDLIWCRQRLVRGGEPVPDWLDAAASRAVGFLLPLVDPRTGLAPLFGANDGSNILPLSEGAFLDFRPVLQATAAVFQRRLYGPPGPWDEAAFWLADDFAALPREPWPVPPSIWHAASGGYLQWCHEESRLFLRCPTHFRHRPGQADQLHVDLSWCGRPVLVDAGSFSYHSKDPRADEMKAARQHNVLTVDGREPMEKYGRFLYLPWIEGGVAWQETPQAFVAWHRGYDAIGLRWTRKVTPAGNGEFVVRDAVTTRGRHAYRWHFLLGAADWKLNATGDAILAEMDGAWFRIGWKSENGPAMARLVHADPHGAVGWKSPHYSEVEAATALEIHLEADGPCAMDFAMGPSNTPPSPS